MSNTYRDIVNLNIEEVQFKQTVTKILRYIDDVRNHNSDELARRWPIELIQNANDVAYENQPVKIKIVYKKNGNESIVEFMHNGKPFAAKNVLHLINQVSSKTSEVESTGKFGTGFMTTYLLSEQVKVQGIVKDDGLPYKKFRFNIDRSDNTEMGVKNSLKNSTEEFLNVDNEEIIDEKNFDKNNFNTCFSYYLKNERSINCAKQGIEDLIYNVNYIISFNERIESIEIVKDIDGIISSELFVKKDEIVVDDNSNNKIFVIECNKNGNTKKNNNIIVFKENNVNVAREIDISKKQVLEINEKTSRIFRDFPLIGTEESFVPFVVNSKEFFPNEARSSIALADNEASLDSLSNKKVILKAASIYKKMFLYLLDNGYKNLQELVRISKLIKSTDMSTSWVVKNIYEDLYVFFENAKFIDTTDGMKSLTDNNCFILTGYSENEIKELKSLFSYTNNIYYSVSMNNLNQTFNNYFEVIDEYDNEFFNGSFNKRQRHLYSLYTFARNATNLINNNLVSKDKYKEVLLKLYNAIKDVKYYENYILGSGCDNFKIFFTQENELTNRTNEISLYSLSELYYDNIEENELKNIDVILSNYNYYISKSYNKGLIRQMFYLNNMNDKYKKLLAKEYDIKPEHKNMLTKIDISDVASDLTTKFTTYTQNDINVQEIEVQKLAMRFLSWIIENKDSEEKIVQKYFLSFANNEEMKNKLRSNKQLAEMTLCYTKYEKLLKDNGFENFEDLIEAMNNNKNQLEDAKNIKNNENNVWIFDDEMLEYLPEGFEGDEDECKKFAEAIGKYGEEIAEKELKKYIEEQKTIMPEKVIEMFNMNTETYKQAGYDFEIISYDKNLLNDASFDRKNNEDTRIKRTYIEVKSHEIRSKLRNHFVISNEQYNMAIKKADNYILLKVDIDSKSIFNTAIWEKVGIKAYRDLINCEKNMIIRPEYLLFQVK